MEPLIVEAASPFSFAIGRSSRGIVVTLHGALDRARVEPFERVLRDLIDDQGNVAVVIDLRDVTMFDGAALDLFVTASGWARRHHASFRLFAPSAVVAEALVGSWLAQEVEIVPWPSGPDLAAGIPWP